MSTAKKKLTTCAPKTAVAYARYSSARQRDVSIEQQLRDIRAYAEREGYTIIHEYADHARSGFKRSDLRAEFQEMIVAAESGVFDTVIAWKVDRFGRNRRESAAYKGRLADLGVSVVYAMEPIPDGAAGCLTEGMLEAIAEWYSRNLSENIKRGQHDNALKNMSNGQLPYGYKIGPDSHYVIDETEAALVRRIFDLYAEGNSCTAIAQTINQEGFRTRKGHEFHRNSIIYILQNDVYIGFYHHGDISTPDGMPVIIDRNLWEVCQNMRRKTTKHHGGSPFEYYFAGKCTCGLCGSKVYATYTSRSDGSKHGYYVCCKKRYKQCSSHHKQKDVIEKPIFDTLFNEILNRGLIDAFVDKVIDALKISMESSPEKKLEEELKTINRKINNIHQAIAEGIWTKQTGEMLTAMTARAENIQNELSYRKTIQGNIISEDRILFYFHKIASGDIDSHEVKRTIANSMINSITIYDAWIRVVLNCIPNVGTIDPDLLPPLPIIPEIKQIGNCTVGSSALCTVNTYPVIVFKIAI